jgi:hypothetical protein
MVFNYKVGYILLEGLRKITESLEKKMADLKMGNSTRDLLNVGYDCYRLRYDI